MAVLGTIARRAARVLLFAVGKIIVRPVRRQLAAFEAATHEPQAIQEALLRRILERQADTQFGRDHRFTDLRTAAEFRRRLPVADYDYFEPYIARMRNGEFDALVAGERVHQFALTSGTTAARKFIPVTDQYLADYRRGWNLWGLKVFRDHPGVRLRPIVQFAGDWDEFRTDAGTPCGAVTGLTQWMQKRIIRFMYCVPPAVTKVKDAASKYYLTLRLSLPRPVGMVVAANPSTMINLARAGDREKEALIRDIHDGTLDPRFPLPPEVRAAVESRLRRRHRERARELEEIVRRTGTLYPRDYWPANCILCNWTGGSVGAYLRHYPRYFGDTPVRDAGLIASEGRMTIPMADWTPSGVLDISTHYFEFLPEGEADSPNPVTVAAHEVEEGRTYYILPTTAYGLYRYHIHDLVRVTGFHNRTPLVEFLSKGSYFANITGEKLSEYHVSHAMADVLRLLDLTLNCYSLAPCWDDELPYYGLFVERGDLATEQQGIDLARRLDQRLAETNPEYASKRDTLRLGAVRLAVLPPGTWQDWDRKRLARSGGTLEQYKHPSLIGDPGFHREMPIERELPV
jgi:hypothetical protein